MTRKSERPGRPSGGDGSNKEQILAAARTEFASKGFRGATMRSIAALAGFDVALLAHYFGNKDGLFAATMALPEQAMDMLVTALSGDPETQGERLTRSYLALWEDAATGPQMQMLARSALINEAAAASMRRIMTGTISQPEVAALLAGRQVGFTLAMSHLLGVAFTRHLNKIPHIAELDFDTLVDRVAPATQLHLKKGQ
ncbi:TetR/AcrR family transcriptional regulator [Paenarthrobacter sp. NPDC056912]|uniref:TetR/AcrR family transcriptional regulator n=1 Tax=Paenarthrobacter sp. NPDC056912 TaxID=3345965 RepID=UPI00367230A3